MKITSVHFYNYACTDDTIKSIEQSVYDLDLLFETLKKTPSVGFLKMENYTIEVLDYNSYPLMSFRVDEKYEEVTLYRF